MGCCPEPAESDFVTTLRIDLETGAVDWHVDSQSLAAENDPPIDTCIRHDRSAPSSSGKTLILADGSQAVFIRLADDGTPELVTDGTAETGAPYEPWDTPYQMVGPVAVHRDAAPIFQPRTDGGILTGRWVDTTEPLGDPQSLTRLRTIDSDGSIRWSVDCPIPVESVTHFGFNQTGHRWAAAAPSGRVQLFGLPHASGGAPVRFTTRTVFADGTLSPLQSGVKAFEFVRDWGAGGWIPGESYRIGSGVFTDQWGQLFVLDDSGDFAAMQWQEGGDTDKMAVSSVGSLIHDWQRVPMSGSWAYFGPCCFALASGRAFACGWRRDWWIHSSGNALPVQNSQQRALEWVSYSDGGLIEAPASVETLQAGFAGSPTLTGPMCAWGSGAAVLCDQLPIDIAHEPGAIAYRGASDPVNSPLGFARASITGCRNQLRVASADLATFGSVYLPRTHYRVLLATDAGIVIAGGFAWLVAIDCSSPASPSILWARSWNMHVRSAETHGSKLVLGVHRTPVHNLGQLVNPLPDWSEIPRPENSAWIVARVGTSGSGSNQWMVHLNDGATVPTTSTPNGPVVNAPEEGVAELFPDGFRLIRQ